MNFVNWLFGSSIKTAAERVMSRDVPTRSKYAAILGASGDPAAVVPLLRALDAPIFYENTDGDDVRLDGGALYSALRQLKEVAFDEMLNHLREMIWTCGDRTNVNVTLFDLARLLADEPRPEFESLMRETLASPDLYLRSIAAQTLSRSKDPHVVTAIADALEKSLSGTAPGVTKRMAFSVGGTRYNPVDDRVFQCVCVSTLKAFNSELALPSLISAFKQGSPYVRKDAILAIGDFDSDDAWQTIDAALTDADKEVRSKTIYMITATPRPKAFPMLVRCLKSDDSYLRFSAAGALKNLANKSAVPDLESALQAETSAEVRNTILSALNTLKAQT